MKDIIKKEYIKYNGTYPEHEPLLHGQWFDDLHAYTAGWLACEEFMLEEQAKEKDYQDLLDDEKALSDGGF